MATGGNLVVNFGANLSGLTRGVGKATGIIGGMASKVGSFGGMLGGFGLALTGVVGAVKGIAEVGQAFGDIDRIAKSAASLGITTEELVGLEHAANLSGVSVDKLSAAMKRAVRGGTTLEAVADKIAATSDPTERARIAFEALGRQGQDLIPLLAGGGQAIRDMMAEGNKLAGFSGVDAKKVEAANDAISRMKLAFTGVARDLAIELAPAVEFIAVGVQKVGEWGRIGFGILKDFAIDAFLVMQFGWEHMGDIATIAWDMVKLGALSFWEDVKFIFSEQLPAVLTWFGKEWGNIIFTAVDYSLTVFMNLGENIRALWQGILDFIAGRGFNVDWTPLAEGFVNTIGELDLPERVMSDAEQKLQKRIADMSGNLMEGLGEHMLAGRGGAPGGAADSFAAGIGDIAGKAAGDLKGPAALQRGSAEAFSSIFAAMRGQSGDPQKDIAENTKRTADQTGRLLKELERQNRGDLVELVAGAI